MKKLKVLFILLSLSFLLMACGEDAGETDSSAQGTDQVQEGQESVEEEDIELTDEEQIAAADVVKSYIKDIYSNTDFSSTEYKGLEYMPAAADEGYIQGLFDELAYVTNNGDLSFEVKDVIIEELVETGSPNQDMTLYPTYIINSKVIFNDETGKENYEKFGSMVSYNTSTGTWKIWWYNFAQHLEKATLWDYVYAQIVPANEGQAEVANLAKHFTQEFFSFGNRESVEDTRGLEELWMEETKSDLVESMIASNESFFQLEKEARPMVANVVVSEMLPFREIPIENASEAYTVTVDIEYEEGKSVDFYESNFVIAKLNDEWKVTLHRFERITPWTYEDSL